MTFNKKSTNHHLETFSTCVSQVEHRGRPGEDGLQSWRQDAESLSGRRTGASEVRIVSRATPKRDHETEDTKKKGK